MDLTGVPVLDAFIVAGVVAGGLSAAGGVVFWLKRKVIDPVRDFLDDWRGEEERPGVPERPGVMARLECLDGRVNAIETEFSNNHGSSARDAIDRIEKQQEQILQKLNEKP